jgi:hypothetical protein
MKRHGSGQYLLPVLLALAFSLDVTPLAAQQQSATSGINKLIGKQDPIITDPNRAYPVVYDLPGAAFHPVSAGGASVLEQLSHSDNGIVRLAPGDYSIPVMLY